MTILSAALVLIVAALLGSIPFGLLIAKIWSGTDVRRIGSGNIGATNVLRASGPLAGALTLLLDAGKGAAAVLLAVAVAQNAAMATTMDETARGLGGAGRPVLGEWAALAAVLGHMFSPWLGFQGGKGVATAAGALAVLSPPAFLLAIAAFGVVFALTRIVSLSSIVACLLIPLVAALGVLPGFPSVPLSAAIAALVVVRHAANIRRLIGRKEARFGVRAPGPPGPGRPGDGARMTHDQEGSNPPE